MKFQVFSKSLLGHSCLGLFLYALTLFPCAYAEDQQRIWRSAYFLGRGDTGISIADNEDAIFYNPAGLALGKGIFKRAVFVSPHVEISTDTRDIAREASQEGADMVQIARSHIGKNQHLGVYNFTGIIFRRAALGVVNSATTDLIIYKSHEAGGLESVKASFVQNNGLTFSLAESIWKDAVQMGTTLKYLQRGQAAIEKNITEVDEAKNIRTSDLVGVGYGGGADLGLMVRGGNQRINPSCGATLMNVGNVKFKAVKKEASGLDKLQQTLNFGCAVEPGTKTSRFKLLADYWDVTNALSKNVYKKLHFGGELSIGSFLGFTGGLSQGSPSFGTYLDLFLLRLDLGFYTEEIGERVGTRQDKRYYLRLMAKF